MAKRSKADKASKPKKAKVTGCSKKSQPEVNLLTAADVTDLVNEVTDKAAYNSIIVLLEQYRKNIDILNQSEDLEAEKLARLLTLSLFKCFESLSLKKLMDGDHTDEKKHFVSRWLNEKYKNFEGCLSSLLQYRLSFDLSLQLDALDVFLQIIRMEAKNSGEFPVQTYKILVKLLLLSEIGTTPPDESSDNFVLLEFTEKFHKYWDLQNYFFDKDFVGEIENWAASGCSLTHLFTNYFTIIKSGLMYTADEEQLRAYPNWVSIQLPDSAFKFNVKTRYQKSFLVVLRHTELNNFQYKALLAILHKRIIPYMAVPAGLMDFLTDAFDQQDDEIVPILALNSLWELMKSHNLEYPDFYQKLYSLLTPTLLCTRYRSRFFRLCDLFLSSTHLSANLVASFIKRLARLALTGNAPSVVIVIPFIYNLLKRHPSCIVLLQNPDVPAGFVDPFDENETDPLRTGAIGSSLWELETLMSHYHPNIATLAKIFREPFQKPSYNMEDFLDWSYLTLLESEKSRKYKGLAALEFEDYDSLFACEDGKSYVEGWTL
ncbi:Noc4 nucleolar protein [Metschnikowia bicuspidata]|uniref:Noc4 nucleolar protein n=1 Tax=Metschnikowia bicuspidata TaxID=27322 RepID=A0A4V1J2G8_9ASCO|nr:Noc4 nucleolar protein [Metschnikowia bicuspidata]RKP29113.1 Noc4 nucleolar protein [Metschnikowia bicuspidata]